MPRTARASAGNVCYHVLNRGNARNTVFHQDGDYGAFLKLLNQANKRVSMRLLAFCLMPNHFHLVAWPRKDGDLSRWMQWLMTSHVRGIIKGDAAHTFLGLRSKTVVQNRTSRAVTNCEFRPIDDTDRVFR